jgi:predicted ATP-dependent serine protease
VTCARCQEAPPVLFTVCLDCAAWNAACERLAQANCGAALELGHLQEQLGERYEEFRAGRHKADARREASR